MVSPAQNTQRVTGKVDRKVEGVADYCRDSHAGNSSGPLKESPHLAIKSNCVTSGAVFIFFADSFSSFFALARPPVSSLAHDGDPASESLVPLPLCRSWYTQLLPR